MRWAPPHATHRGAYPQLRYVCQKRWQLLHCRGLFGATYDSTDTRRQQSSVMDRTLDTSGPRATDTMKWGVRSRSLAGFWSRQLHDCLDMNVQGLQLLPEDALRHSPAQVLHQKPHTTVLRERKGVETHTLPPIKGPQCADHGSKTVGG